MKELYWITRLDAIREGMALFFVIALVILCLAFLVYVMLDDEDIVHFNLKKTIKITIPFAVLFMILYILIPTTKEAYVIYGVGGTIDYIKSNDKAKQLPDKCIKALDKFLDNYIIEEEEK